MLYYFTPTATVGILLLAEGCLEYQIKYVEHMCFSFVLSMQWTPYNSGLDWLSLIYDCKEIPTGLLYSEKLAESILLRVFKITFPASLLKLFYNYMYEF